MKTTTGYNWSSGPMWVRQRSLGKNKPKRVQASHDLVRRLGVEASFPFDGKNYYKFLMDWNQQGTLLAVAQANRDRLLFVWDVFKQQEVCRADTGFTWSDVSSVKFLPDSDTQVVACRGVGGVRLIDIINNENYLVSDRSCINDMAVHPSEPNLIWSASWDGHIVCFDIRQSRECASYRYQYRSAGCIAINPLRSDILAIGFFGGDTRLIDKRALKTEGPQSSIARYKPVDPNAHRYLGLLGLAFNSNGSELLVSVHGEQFYLFSTNEPWETYQSFDLSIKPLLSNEPDLTSQHDHSELRPHSYLNELQKQCPVEMQDELKAFCDDILSRNSTFKGPRNIIDCINKSLGEELPVGTNSNQQTSSLQNGDIIFYLNELLDKVKNCPDLYRARATAFMRRAHRGDYHQALRDCCCALALKPLDFRTIRCLSSILVKLENEEDVRRLLDFIEDAVKEFGDHDDLINSRETLQAFKEMKENEIVTDVEPETRSDSEFSNSGSSHSSSSHFEPVRSEHSHSESVHSESAHSESSHPDSTHHIEADPTREFDYSRCYKSAEAVFRCFEVNFFGSNDEFIIGGTETAFHVWDKNTNNIVKSVDDDNVRFVLPHPTVCMVATSGPGDAVKLWSPLGKESQNVEG